MAVTLAQLDAVGQVMDHLNPNARRTILALGYPDILAPAQVLDRFFGDGFSDRIAYREDSEEIIAWHGMTGIMDKVPEAFSMFDAMGCDLSVIDIMSSRGDEEIVDLNEELPRAHVQGYDLVIDPGTIEHCFNIGQAIRNAASAVKLNGYIIHFNPMAMFNHGFFNLNPTFYHDFYLANGFTLVGMVGVHGPPAGQKTFPAEATARFPAPPDNANNLVIAQRTTVKPFEWPMQTKYRENPSLKS